MIALLSCPLSHWVVKEDSVKPDDDDNNNNNSAPTTTSTVSPSFPSGVSTVRKNKSVIDRQEFNNVKLLCAQVLKGHKKLSKQLKACEEKLKREERERANSNILFQLKEQQQIQFRHQLIALDMKERAFRAHVKAMEERCMNHCKDELSNWKESMDLWKTRADGQWKEWKVLLDHEMQINAQFRTDLCQWMEEYQFHDCQKENKNDRNNNDDDDDDKLTPILFATNLGEVGECVPLCSSNDSSSSSSSSGDNCTGDEMPEDRWKISPLPRLPFQARRQRHSWKPHVRNWDRFSL